MYRPGAQQVTGDKLQVIYSSPKVQSIIVAVPGLTTPKVSEWRDMSKQFWLRSIPSNVTPGAAIFGYEHALDSPKTFSWNNLLNEGDSLLESLSCSLEEQNLGHCPILFVCHSLGGMIVKQALILAFRNQRQNRFLRAVAGLLCLGTPHSTSDDEQVWQSITSLVPTGTFGKKQKSIGEEDLSLLSQCCLQFEQAGVQFPILSVYETQDSKIRLSPTRTTKLKPVAKKLAVMELHTEHVIPADCDHKSLCALEVQSEAFRQISNVLETAFEDARLRIAFDSPSLQASSGLDDWSVLDTAEQPSETARTIGDSWSAPGSISESFSLYATATSTSQSFNVVRNGSHVSFHHRTVNLPCHIMPIPRNRGFVGRGDALQAIDKAFFGPLNGTSESDDHSNDTRTFAICGLGGVGKTQVAAQFAHTRKDRFDAIFWISAENAQKLGDEFNRIALKLGLINEDSVDAQDTVVTLNLVKGWLADPVKYLDTHDPLTSDKATWLLIFDNVEESEELEEFWPLDGPGCVLFTSRDPVAKRTTFLATSGIDLQPFSSEEASRFLTKLTGKTGDSKTVSERLGGLPLALTQMASIINRRDWTLEEFVEHYDREDARKEIFQVTDKSNTRLGYEKNLWSVWAVEALKHGGTLLNVLSLLDPDGIQEKIFIKTTAPIRLKGFPRKEADYERARTELLQTSLITRDITSGKLLIHRLVQDAARTKLNESPENLNATFGAAVQLISAVWPSEEFGWRHGVSKWRICQDLFPHIQRLFIFSEHLDLEVGTPEINLTFAELLMKAGWYRHEVGYSIESQPFFEKAMTITKYTNPQLQNDQTKQRVRRIVAECHHNLGCVGTETNQTEMTLQHFRIFNEMMCAEIQGNLRKTDKRLAISWNELGNAHMLDHEWERAEECFKKSLETARLLDEFDPSEMSFPFVNLGLAYWITDRLEEAKAVLEEGLGYREAAYGKDDNRSFITGRFLHALGNVMASQSKLDESFKYHRRALSQYENTIGRNHHRTGDVHVKVAEHLLRLKQYDDVEAHLDEALRIFGQREIHQPEKARALFRKSLLCSTRQRFGEAQRLREESLTLYLRLHPESSKNEESLTGEDFDEAIAFWSR